MNNKLTKFSLIAVLIGVIAYQQKMLDDGRKDRALLWEYGKALQASHETHREFVLPKGWERK